MPLAVEATPIAADDKLSCSILLVEDNQEIAIATEPLLQTVGCSVQWASSGDLARALIDADPDKFDLVVSDMAMPGELDGLGLAEYLRRRYPHIRVLLTTGYTNKLQEAIARRFTVLAKPCAPETLVNAIRDAIRKGQPAKSIVEQ